jgi:hypothetical protein
VEIRICKKIYIIYIIIERKNIEGKKFSCAKKISSKIEKEFFFFIFPCVEFVPYRESIIKYFILSPEYPQIIERKERKNLDCIAVVKYAI